MPLKFRILGSLEAESAAGRLQLGGRREQRLLAALLLDADRVVPLARLSESVWDDQPATAAKQVRNGISKLRRLLGAAETCGFIVTEGSGYRLMIGGHEIDARLFQERVTQSQLAASAGRVTDAADILRMALMLWRGSALAGLGGRVLEAAAAAWNERRCAVLETYYGYMLAMGHHRETVGELADAAADYPFREKLVGQYMLALYRCACQADALAVYRATQVLLVDALGLDPGPELRLLHQQILRNDAALAAPTPVRQELSLPDHAAMVPRQLPSVRGHFAGRSAEMAMLTRLLEESRTSTSAVTCAVEGMAGVGKTTLAVHWAHHVAEWFPDGQLYLNLRGYDTSAVPVTPARAVRGLLDSLGVAPERIPVGLDAQAALYRSLLAGRHILVVLDNARDGEQVRPLLPGSPGCMALVTSRSQLTSLIIADGAYPLILGILNNHEARDLLAGRIGQNRVDPEPEAVEHIIASCGRLPLALSVVAARAAAHPTFSLRALARELRDTSTGELDALDNDEATVSLRAAFCRSYQQLSSPAARLFRLLALHPGPDITIAAAASLAGISATTARPLLTELASAYLTTEQEPGRFTLHELLRAYAAERVKHQDSGAERHAASRRMLDHYLHTAHSASRLINPHPVYGPLSLEQPCAETVPESLADDRAASAWFDAEYLVLIAVTDHAAAMCEDAHAWQLAASLNEYCRRQGRWEDWLNVQRTALTSAQRQGSRLGQACAHAAIGRAYSWLGQHDDAGAHLHQALHLFGELGDKPGQASIHMSLAWIADRQYHGADALGNDRQALALYRAAGHAPGLASALNNLGWSYTELGDYSQALACCEEALALQRRLDDLRGQAHTLDSIGYAHHHLGQHQEAAASFRQALALYQQLGSLNSQVDVLDHLGDALAAADDRAAANATWTRALDILTQLTHPAAHLIQAKLCNQSESSTACDPGQ